MNAHQEARLNMYRVVETLCLDNAATLALMPALQATFATFSTKITAIVTTVQQQDKILLGITADKNVIKQNLARLAADIAGAISAYATATNNLELKGAVQYTYTDLLRSRDDVLAPRCRNIYDRAMANAAALANYGVSATLLSVFQDTIDAYFNTVPKPRSASSLRQLYTSNIKILTEEATKLLREQMDKLVALLKNTHPDFVRSYKNARVLHDPTTVQTQLKGYVFSADDNMPIANALVSLNDWYGKTVLSGNDGSFLFKPIKNGDYNLVCEAEGYDTQSLDKVHITRGQVNKLTVRLMSL